MSTKLCWAADVGNLDQALEILSEIRHHIDVVKVGPELFLGAGKPALEIGLPIFLDLKLHDIPETVERTILRAADCANVKYMTLHVQQRETLERAVKAAEKVGIQLLCVTVLTSMTESDGQDLEYQRSWPQDRAYHMMTFALRHGITGFVCSPEEVRNLRKFAREDFSRVEYRKLSLKAYELLPDGALFFCTPGIRPQGADLGDQKRIGTPRQAMLDGSDMLVVGRPIRDAQNRIEAVQAIRKEMNNANFT